VLDVTPQGMKLIELAPGVNKEEVIAKTACALDTSAV
jgi:3-oxoacid CoA-transferase subunit B